MGWGAGWEVTIKFIRQNFGLRNFLLGKTYVLMTQLFSQGRYLIFIIIWKLLNPVKSIFGSEIHWNQI